MSVGECVCVCACMQVHVHMCAYSRACVCGCERAYMSICVRICVCAHVGVDVRTCMFACLYACVAYLAVETHVCGQRMRQQLQGCTHRGRHRGGPLKNECHTLLPDHRRHTPVCVCACVCVCVCNEVSRCVHVKRCMTSFCVHASVCLPVCLPVSCLRTPLCVCVCVHVCPLSILSCSTFQNEELHVALKRVPCCMLVLPQRASLTASIRSNLQTQKPHRALCT